MIQSLEIQNFQSHKYSKLEFANGVNVIVGGSDTGKTSIIRALRWLIWNRPSGDAFRSTWDGITGVEIITNSDSIVRWKGKTESGYGLDEQEFKAFGTEVPEEIIQALNVNEINLQQQLDRPFLLDATPGEVAQHFNKVAHLDQIDNGLRKVQQWIRGIEQDVNSNEKQAEQLEEDLQTFAYLDVFEKDVEVLERMQSQLTTKMHSKQKLIQLIDSLRNVTIEITQESEIIQAEKTLNNILQCIVDRKAKQHEKGLLNRVIQEAKQITDSLQKQENITSAEKSVDQILDLFNDRKELKENLNKLEKVLDDINDSGFEYMEKKLNKLQQKFIAIFPNVCPLCGQKKKL